jgi:hypothetical protein
MQGITFSMIILRIAIAKDEEGSRSGTFPSYQLRAAVNVSRLVEVTGTGDGVGYGTESFDGSNPGKSYPGP